MIMTNPAYTVGMYSPGKAFVVYDIRRHVYIAPVSVGHSGSGSFTGLYEPFRRHRLQSQHTARLLAPSLFVFRLDDRKRTLSDWVAGAAISDSGVVCPLFVVPV